MGQGGVGNEGRTTRGYYLPDDEPGDKHELSRETIRGREGDGQGLDSGSAWPGPSCICINVN